MEQKQNILDDTYIIYDVDELKDINFEDIKKEIEFEQMFSQQSPVPRLVAIQGIFYNEMKPIYRHPVDAQPGITEMTLSVKKICDVLSKKLNQNFNHVLIQLYRDGLDYIGEHSDKTLDIEKNTNIVNYTIGSTRVMRLKSKKNNIEKNIIKIPLKHNSMFVLSWDVNRKYLHYIKQDKRDLKEKSSDELRNNGERISFTFRTIVTFIDKFNNIIGQGSKFKKINVDIDMLKAFSKENHDADFEWEYYYQ
jgi:hypothetical protein